MRFTSLLAALVLAAPLAFAADGVKEAGAPLRHAENDLLPNAHGGVGIRTGSDFERFTVAVEGVGELVTLKVQLGDGHEHFAEIGTLASGLSNRRMEFTTREGGHLPGDAEHAGDLSGRGVRVVDGENHLVLLGEVPRFETTPPVVEPPHEHPAEPVSARAVMQRPEGSTLPESRGVVVAVHGPEGDALRCEVGRLAAHTGYVLFVGGDDAVVVGDFTTSGEGNALLVREAEPGQAFGEHLPSLADLAGRRAEVRDREGHVVLYGHVPAVETPHDAEPVHEEGEAHDESGADVHVVVEIHPDRGHETLRIEMHDLPTHDGADGEHHEGHLVLHKAARRPRAELLLDDGTGTMEEVASVRVGRRGRAIVRFTTRRHGRLPLGVATLRDLAGRGFEVRVGGVRAVGGSLPTF